MGKSKTARLASDNLLRKIDDLREKNIGQHIPLPQLVVVGDQSSGKSSLLESLTKIPFPRDLELCTRYATQITSRRDSESRVNVSIIPGPNASVEHSKYLNAFHPEGLTTEGFRLQFPGILKEVNARMGIRMDPSSKDGNVFSEDVLKIEICGSSEDYLTVIDVPGIFRNPMEGVTTKRDIELVQNMVKEYIKDSRTIILAVLPSNVDIATQEILTLAQDYDKAGERTLGVLTKPDLVKEHSAIVAVSNLVLGKKKPLTLGYYVVRNRGADDDDTFDHAANEEMFRQEPWSRVPKDRVGVQALKTRLGELLAQITRNEFPKLRSEVKKQLVDCRRELESLGLARQTEQEQRLFLNTLTHQFQDLVGAALNARYHNHEAFEEQEELRLITHVVNLTEMFNYDFEKKGQLRYFESPAPESSPDGKECTLDESKKESTWADMSAMKKLAAMDQAMFLVYIERNKRPYTLNGYFNENLQRLRVEKLEGKARKEASFLFDDGSSNLVVDLDVVAKANKSSVEYAKEEIHDILSSYYEVARKRFVDNVYHQAVDHCLLTGPMSPLAVFNQEWVITLEAEQLEAIAGELPVTKGKRAALVKKIHDLETALGILKP
ncbi:P-loop containing nucleoside triphosphate hydrolase protein [Elaphomyces granulatus]